MLSVSIDLNFRIILSFFSVLNLNFQTVVNNELFSFGEYWCVLGCLPSITVNYLLTYKLNALDNVVKDTTINIKVNDFKNSSALTTINQSDGADVIKGEFNFTFTRILKSVYELMSTKQ